MDRTQRRTLGHASFQKEEPVETDDADLVLNVELPDIHQCVATLPKALPSIWGTRSQRILVRFEYSVAEREAISVSSARHSCAMFIVTGQPGIGVLAPLFFSHHPQRPTSTQESPCFHSASHAPTSVSVHHRATGRARLCNPLSREWRLLVYTAREQPSLHLALHLHSCGPDLALVATSPTLPEPAFVVNAISSRFDRRERFWKAGHDLRRIP